MRHDVIGRAARAALCLLVVSTLAAYRGPAAAAKTPKTPLVVAAWHAPIGRAVQEARERALLGPDRLQKAVQLKARIKTGTQAAPVRAASEARFDASTVTRAEDALPAVTTASTCTVNTPADSGAGSLRQCLATAAISGTIVFNPAVFPPLSPVAITLASPLPTIITNSLTIDASDAGVILDGGGLSGTGTGLVVDGVSGVTIRGLRIVNFPVDGIELTGGASNNFIGGMAAGAGNVIGGNGEAGIWINGAGTDDNQVLGNYVGVDATGTAAMANQWGVVVGYGAQGNVIGGTAAGARNVISGNDTGVQFQNAGTSGNQVLGNYIGADATGLAALGNYSLGVYLTLGADGNTVGGTAPGARNVISGNFGIGVAIDSNGPGGNVILGNYIGVDATGANALGNDTGVVISGARNNVVGGSSPGARNVISGNYDDGLQIQDAGANNTSGNTVLGNYIGVGVTGANALGNADSGVVIAFGADNNFVGGAEAGEGNVISGNGVPE